MQTKTHRSTCSVSRVKYLLYEVNNVLKIIDYVINLCYSKIAWVQQIRNNVYVHPDTLTRPYPSNWHRDWETPRRRNVWLGAGRSPLGSVAGCTYVSSCRGVSSRSSTRRLCDALSASDVGSSHTSATCGTHALSVRTGSQCLPEKTWTYSRIIETQCPTTWNAFIWLVCKVCYKYYSYEYSMTSLQLFAGIWLYWLTTDFQ